MYQWGRSSDTSSGHWRSTGIISKSGQSEAADEVGASKEQCGAKVDQRADNTTGRRREIGIGTGCSAIRYRSGERSSIGSTNDIMLIA